MGIKKIVENAADVASAQKVKLQKDDAVDNRKLARKLHSGDLSDIHIPCISTMEDRSLVRVRSALVKNMSRFKQRIKSHLYLDYINPLNIQDSRSVVFDTDSSFYDTGKFHVSSK